MTLEFPQHFFFGTSTSAYQIETSFEHDWLGLRARDGYVFDRTTDHELRVDEDVEIISSLAPNYRMSLMWSRLQRSAYGELEVDAVAHYHRLLGLLKGKEIDIMMVLYHWCNPTWFSLRGGWESKDSVSLFLDFAKKLIDEFGGYVTYWNTLNEPNLYATFSYGLGEFPPFQKDVFKSVAVIKNLAEAHERTMDYLKQKYPHAPVGVSHNCVFFAHDNIAGTVPAKIADYWYTDYLPGFFNACDYIGISYYAKLSFDPFPVTYLRTSGKFVNGRPHDDIWEYYPAGMGEIITRFWAKYGKPIIIAENGICTRDDNQRKIAIADYMRIIHQALAAGVDVRGYYHWSAWDNFEWTLGPTYKFGLFDCDPATMSRTKKESGELYSKLAFSKRITV